MVLKKNALFLLALPALGSALQAAEIESLTVTGTRSQAPEFIAQSVMTREQLERINPQSTVNLLQAIPNIIISSDGVAGHSHVSIRGGEPNFTLVMIDGVAVNDPTNSSGGGFDFNQLDPAVIERVEVYRGGVSAIYGGEALSGVIHFITRQADASSLNVELGSDWLQRGSLNYSRSLSDNSNLLLSLSSSSQEFSDYTDFSAQQALLKLNTQMESSRHQLLLTASKTDRHTFAENSGGNLFASPYQGESRDSEQQVASWSAQYELTDARTLHSRLSWTEHEEFSDHPGIIPGVIDGIPASMISSEYRKLDADLYLQESLADDFSLLGGINLKDAEGSNAGTLDFGFPVPAGFTLQQENYSVYGEATKSISDWQFNLGLRYDMPDDFDEELSSRLSLSWQLSPQTRVQASYSEGYKLPSIFALAHPLVGNPNLRPELSKNADLGIAFETAAGYVLEMSVFRNRFEDLVAFSPTLFTNINQSEVKTQGAEAAVSRQLTDWLGVAADINYLDTDVIGSQEKAKRRPDWSGSVRFYADMNDFSFNLLLTSRSDFFDTAVPTGEVALSGYSSVDFTAHWYWLEDVNFSLSLDNLLDERYQQAVGFEDPGRQIRLGMQMQF